MFSDIRLKGKRAVVGYFKVLLIFAGGTEKGYINLAIGHVPWQIFVKDNCPSLSG